MCRRNVGACIVISPAANFLSFLVYKVKIDIIEAQLDCEKIFEVVL